MFALVLVLMGPVLVNINVRPREQDGRGKDSFWRRGRWWEWEKGRKWKEQKERKRIERDEGEMLRLWPQLRPRALGLVQHHCRDEEMDSRMREMQKDK